MQTFTVIFDFWPAGTLRDSSEARYVSH